MTNTITLPREVIEQAIDTLGYYASVAGEDDQDTPAKQMQAALRAELAQQAEQGWQPISTAPKDGSTIVVGFGRQSSFPVLIVFYNKMHKFWSHYGEAKLGLEVNATHWMPLPAAPKGAV